MPLPTPKSLAQFQSDFTANWNAVAGNAPGTVIPNSDPLVAIGASNSGSALYLQSLIYGLVSFSRASTAEGPDLDSWFADFQTVGPNGQLVGFQRPPGEPAQVLLDVTVNPALNGGNPVVLQQGALLQTSAIIVQPSSTPAVYQFSLDEQQSFAASRTYQVSATAAAAVTTNGIPGFSIYNNIPVGAISAQYNPVAGITSVTNPSSPSGGTNAASDAQARADFVLFITALAKSNAAGVEAGIQDAFGSLELGVNYNLYSNASAPTLVQPGLIMAVFISPGKSGQYTGATFDPSAQAILNSMEADEAFGLTPVVYYATQYAVTAISLTFTYSLSALNQAGLSLSALEQLIAGVISSYIPPTGASLGSPAFYSAIASSILAISVTLPTGVVEDIVTDINVPALSMTTSGGTFAGDKVQPGTTSVIDQKGYLSWSGSPTSISFTANQAP